MPCMLLLDDPHGSAARGDDDALTALRARLAARLLAALPEAGDHVSAVPGLSFYRRDGFCPPASALYEPGVSLVVQGHKHVVLGSQTYNYGAGHFVLTSVDLPTIAQVLGGSAAHPFLSMILKLDLDQVQEVAAEIDLKRVAARQEGTGFVIGTVAAELYDALLRLAALADTPNDIAVMGRHISREVVYRLLIGPAGAQLRQIATQGSRCHRIAKVISWLREHHAEPIRIEALAEMAAMGVSTLHHHFTAITRMSPLQYQKRIRLHEARRFLLTEPIDAATAAYRVGYESVTQFSREYRREFGNPPMRDIGLIRGR